MGQRRNSRELAMQALYYIDLGNEEPIEAYKLFCIHYESDEGMNAFFEEIVEGTLKHKSEIDSHVEKFSNNWKLSRMSGIDRNIIRIAVYEMLYCNDIPSTVTINEAIDIGKKFGTKDSGAFINGILDAISQNLET